MKFLLTALIAVCFYCKSYSQVARYKVYEYTAFKPGDNDKAKHKWQEIALILVFNPKESVIKVYGNEEYTYSLIKRTKLEANTTKGSVEIIYDAINGKGEKLQVQLIVWEDKQTKEQSDASFALYEKTQTTLYMMKKQ